MKYQTQFSENRNKKFISICSLLKILPSMQSVKLLKLEDQGQIYFFFFQCFPNIIKLFMVNRYTSKGGYSKFKVVAAFLKGRPL